MVNAFYKNTSFLLFYSKWLKLVLGKTCIYLVVKNDRLVVSISSFSISGVLLFLRDHTNCLFTVLCDLSCTDFFRKFNRIEVVYQLLSPLYSSRVMLRVTISVEDSLCSAVSIFASANWFEREIFDLFGINFYNHPDMRRILTDYGFEGFPLRKDFPLSGFVEIRFDSIKKRVVCEQILLSQESRSQTFLVKK